MQPQPQQASCTVALPSKLHVQDWNVLCSNLISENCFLEIQYCQCWKIDSKPGTDCILQPACPLPKFMPISADKKAAGKKNASTKTFSRSSPIPTGKSQWSQKHDAKIHAKHMIKASCRVFATLLKSISSMSFFRTFVLHIQSCIHSYNLMLGLCYFHIVCHYV